MEDTEVSSTLNILERMLLDEHLEPRDLPFSLLESITNGFSDDQKIGSGGFAVVYEGRLQNGAVAVKKLSHTFEVHETKFFQEVDSLMKVKHKNIVRFLGYCADTQGKISKYEGKNVMADERRRLLCFEFLPKGSLDKYISDASEGLEWTARYHIIKGICEGLQYLHQQKIVHLDLKPANILLNHYMVPKIADFGLSKCFDETQTRALTLNLFGSLGYMAPEFYGGVITFKSDIYSLGIIITEMLTGCKGCPDIENVLENWRTRFQTSQEDIRLEYVTICAEIGIKCMDPNPAKRPDAQSIIERLHEIECTYPSHFDFHGCGEAGFGSTISHLAGDKATESSEAVVKIPDFPLPKHMQSEEITNLLRMELLNLRRQHESKVQDMTEELFRVKRKYLEEKSLRK